MILQPNNIPVGFLGSKHDGQTMCITTIIPKRAKVIQLCSADDNFPWQIVTPKIAAKL